VSGAICKCSDTSHLHQIVTNKQAISSFAHHTINILKTGHPFNVTAIEFIPYFVINIIREVVLEKLDPLQQCAVQRKNIWLRRRYIEIGLWNRSFRDRF
jgi:hypothetical protein